MSHVQNITDTHNTNMCDMYKSSLRHIHDPVLLSQVSFTIGIPRVKEKKIWICVKVKVKA